MKKLTPQQQPPHVNNHHGGFCLERTSQMARCLHLKKKKEKEKQQLAGVAATI